jgi:ribosomal-protein-alanine N-acetyltransferase
MNKKIDISNVKIQTKRLLLRPFNKDDLLDFFNYAHVEGVGEMAGWQHHKTIEESKMILDKFIENKNVFAICKDNKVIGSLGIELYNEEKFPEFNNYNGREIGYVLAKEYWGNGLMPEALEAVINYLFKEEKLDFLLCSHFLYNNQSRRCMEKVGFKHYKLIDYIDRTGNVNKTYVSLLENPYIVN